MDSSSPAQVDHRWAVILAGGDGQRLLPLTRILAGDDRPKQFCSILGAETLLEQTLRRVAQVVSPDQMFSVVTETHERFYSAYRTDARDPRLLVQPCNRGTCPAILHSLARLQHVDPRAVVGFFPSDHHFRDSQAFSDCVRQAYETAELYSSAVILLGVAPNEPEPNYGWIEPGEPLMMSGQDPVFRVRRFWEKPACAVAVDLMRRGCLWNSFVMVGRLDSFLRLVGRAAPELLRSFQTLARDHSAKQEESRLRELYLSIPSSSFSTDILSVCPSNLAVLRNKTLEWTDVGDVGRALSLMARQGARIPPRIERSPQRASASLAAAASQMT